jgi:RNA polymerase sigma-70 factor (ECF subfamily)
MPNLSESEVIEKAIAGDAHAFRLLVERHQAFAYSLSYRFVSSYDDAADIAQEAFIRLWKNIARYRAEVKLTTWLYKIITNLCLDYLKSKHRKHHNNVRSVDDFHSITDPMDADQSLLDEEFRKLVFEMTKELTPKQKAVFILRDMEELEMKEISEILSMSTGNVKSNLYYARVKMSELVKKCYREKKMKQL